MKSIGYYFLLTLLSIVVITSTSYAVFAQTNPYENLIPNASPELLEQIFGQQISDQSVPADLNQNIAPPPLIVITSDGNAILYQGDGVKAQISIDQAGTDWTTYYIQGSPVMKKSEFGEEQGYQYQLDGQLVNLINSQGAIVSSETYHAGQLLTFSGQGNIEYFYNNENILVASKDDFGNVTTYDKGRPSKIVNSAGEIIGTYKYNGSRLTTFTDQYGNTTYFGDDGIRPSYTSNSAGTVTQVYHYDAQGNLDYVVNSVTQESTDVNQGYYTQIVNSEGQTVGVYNYNVQGYATALSEVAMNGVITGWTEYDDYGRPMATYNGQGSLVQSYVYNGYGFLQQTINLGAIDPLTGSPTVLSYTNYDRKGRPNEVYQHGEGDNYIMVQQYLYKTNGLLDVTNSYGVQRDTQGNAVLDANGNLTYILTGKTTYDSFGRPSTVYNELGELQQKYVYNSKGFMDATNTYGVDGAFTGKTTYDAYSRPRESLNTNSALTQLYSYGQDGFLNETVNYGQNDTITGHTEYNNYGRPTDVYNQTGSLTQQYVYDENGLLVMSLSFNREGELTDVSATYADKQAVLALWNNEWNVTYAGLFGDMDAQTLTNAAWAQLDAGNYEAAMACVLKCITLYSEQAQTGGNQGLINHVGTAYFILGRALEGSGQTETAISAYKVQVDEFSTAQAYDPATNSWWNVSDASRGRLTALGAGSAVITGYTVFDYASRPTASYQYYNDGIHGLQASKVQDYVYLKKGTVGYDEQNRPITGDVATGFVTKTINYGDNETNIGYTEFDKYGRQSVTYNESGAVVQKYNYSNQGFLAATLSYGKDNYYTGKTLFDFYGRPVMSLNNYSSGQISDAMMSEIQNGLTEDIINDPDWQPLLKGLTQTFEYGSDGFLNVSKSWGQATEINVQKTTEFQKALGSVKGQSNYNAAFDFNADEKVDNADLAIFETSFNGVSAFLASYGSSSGSATYNASYDYNSDGVIDNRDANEFYKTFSSKIFYKPTYTGETHYDQYGKADQVLNVQGVVVQDYEYNMRGFLTQSHSYGVMTDSQGNAMLDGTGNPIMVETGRTIFDSASRPTETYSLYNDGTNGEQLSLAQRYVYEDGFVTQTNNFGRDGQSIGYTTFDNAGRQKTTFNEFDQKTSAYIYSNQGFLTQTYSYGKDGAFTGRTIFNNEGKPIESYNMYADNKTFKGLTQKFNYNQFGFLANSENFGENQALTGTTYYDGYGKALRSENVEGVAVSSYDYDAQGFLKQTNNLAFVEDVNGPLTITLSNGQQAQGFYVSTGYTLFDYASRPTESWSKFNDGTHGEQSAKVQEYVYKDGFVTQTNNFGRNGANLGYTTFDRFGRQEKNFNEFNEVTAKYNYSSQGFLDKTYNYGQDGTYVGQTIFNELGRPTDSYNQNGNLKTGTGLQQSFHYDKLGQMDFSQSFGEDQTPTGTTTYDHYGKALYSTNAENEKVQEYRYDATGFLLQTVNLGRGGVQTGYTLYDDASRPTSSYSLYNGVAAKVQDFVYNKAATGAATDVDLGKNTGFVTETISYGDLGTFIGYTTFNRFGQQDSSYNEFKELTSRYIYSRAGFLDSSYNYGRDRCYLGKTEYNAQSRPTESYNQSGALVQTFIYGTDGFLTSSESFGENKTKTSTTNYDAYGKATDVINPEGIKIQSYVYNERGFLTRSNNLAAYEVNGTVQYVTSGYTLYNAASRPTETYSVFNDGTHGEREVKVQEFIYGAQGTSNTGFITETQSYTLNLDSNGNPVCTDAVASDIGTEIVVSGKTTYDRYGRPDTTYNHTLTQMTSKNTYSQQGFLSQTTTYGENNAYTGKITYDNLGRTDKGYNYTGALTSEYRYNNLGMLSYTLGYQGEGVLTSKTTYDIYGKQKETFQLYKSSQETVKDETFYKYDQNGTTMNYSIDANGDVTGGSLLQKNDYNEYGFVKTTITYGRDSSTEISYTYYDTYQRPTEVRNEKNQVVQSYTYSATTGFLQYTTSFFSYEELDDNGNIKPGEWVSETSRTYYDTLGRQFKTVLLIKNEDETYTDGALQNTYQYTNKGFLEKVTMYQDSKYNGYVSYDISGKQREQFNAQNTKVASYHYNQNGFMVKQFTYGQ